MRTISADYTTAMGQYPARPCLRVYLANHGGGYADPLDVTPWVLGADIDRPLRDGNGASISLASPDDIFAPTAGTYALAVRPGVAEVRVDMGEIIGGVETWARVFTGRIIEALPNYDDVTTVVNLECVDRVPNPWTYNRTSPYYEPTGATPVYWTAHQIIKDLFSRYFGFTDPADYNLDAAGDWTLAAPAQFEDTSVASMAALCLQPSGYRVFFDYNGDLASALLLQGMNTAAWVVNGTVVARNIDFPIEGPTWTRPNATRTRVSGGSVNQDMLNIGGHSILGTGHIKRGYIMAEGYRVTDGSGGDVFEWVYDATGFHLWYQGAEEETWREFCSSVGDIRYPTDTGVQNYADATWWTIAPFIDYGEPESDTYDVGKKRHIVKLSADSPIGGFALPLMDAEIDIHGHQTEIVRPKVWAQAWDDALITIWGEIRQEIQSPLAQAWDVANDIATREQIIGTLSAIPVGVQLARLDLRWEAGDFLTIENDRGSNFNMWVESVSYGVEAGRGGATSLQGYLVP